MLLQTVVGFVSLALLAVQIILYAGVPIQEARPIYRKPRAREVVLSPLPRLEYQRSPAARGSRRMYGEDAHYMSIRNLFSFLLVFVS